MPLKGESSGIHWQNTVWIQQVRDTILITGGAGYIGSHAVLACVDQGRRVVVLDDLSSGSAEHLPPGVTLTQGSMGDATLVRRVIREHSVGAVMHFAAKTVVPESIAEPIRYYRNNLANSISMLETLLEEGVERLVFSSTAAVYDPDSALQKAVDERAPTRPISPYGRSKLMVEQVLRDTAAATRLRPAVLRYFNVAGADPNGRSGQSTPQATHLIKVACQVALGLRPQLDVYGDDFPTPDGTCVRDFIHVSDLAAAHMLALQHLELGGGPLTLNCGYGRGVSVWEVVRAVERVTGNELPVRTVGRRSGDAARVVADSTALRNKFGWAPEHDDLDEIVRSALRWEARISGRQNRLAGAAATQ